MPKITHSKATNTHGSDDKSNNTGAGKHDNGDDMIAYGQPAKASAQSDDAQKQSNMAHGKRAAKSGRKA